MDRKFFECVVPDTYTGTSKRTYTLASGEATLDIEPTLPLMDADKYFFTFSSNGEVINLPCNYALEGTSWITFSYRENDVDVVSARRNKSTLAYELTNRYEMLLVDQNKPLALTEILDDPTPTSKQEIIINLGNNSCVVEYDGEFKIKGGE